MNNPSHILEVITTSILIFINWLVPDYFKYMIIVGSFYSYLRKLVFEYMRPLDTVDHTDINTNIQTNTRARNMNGTSNSLKCPLRGSYNQPILYNTPMYRIKYETNPVISKDILALFDRKKYTEESNINILAGAWVQFMIHDWFNTGSVYEKGKYKYNLNTNDHWWSGSQIYGTEDGRPVNPNNGITNECSIIRDGDYLKLSGDYLPLNTKGEEIVGFRRNFWSGIGFLHHLFALEHNYIVDELKKNGCEPSRIFEIARLIISATIAKIHTIDWTTAIIQNDSARATQYLIWFGFKGQNNTFNTGTSVIDGLKTQYNEKSNFSHTAEFVSTYRLHSLLPDTVELRSYKTQQIIDYIDLRNIALENSPVINQTREGQLNLLYSMGMQKAGKLCLGNYPKTLRNILGLDLAETDLIRDRERGVPKYNELRRTLFLKPYNKFEDMTSDVKLIKSLKKAYPKGINTMDTLVGLLLEKKIPGMIFGETTYNVFVSNTTKRIESDRFLSQCFTPEYYTDFGINYVNMSSMSKILTRHYPEMKEFIDWNTNSFIPWNNGDAKNLYEDVTGIKFIDKFFYIDE